MQSHTLGMRALSIYNGHKGAGNNAMPDIMCCCDHPAIYTVRYSFRLCRLDTHVVLAITYQLTTEKKS